MVLFHRVAKFRAQLESLETHLDREAHEQWVFMDNTWGLNHYLGRLGDKVDDLRHLHNEVSAAVSSRRARHLGGAAWAFTALGVITVGLAVTNFLTNDVKGLDLDVALGVLVTIVFLIGALWVFRLGWVEKAEVIELPALPRRRRKRAEDR